jgi:tetratricopeptide (TPR) repeat protein
MPLTCFVRPTDLGSEASPADKYPPYPHRRALRETGRCAESLYRSRRAASSRLQTTPMRRFATVATVLLLAVAGATAAAGADDAAQSSLTAGINAYRQGNLEASIETLSQALRGSISSRQAARAYYYRGLAYRALGRPAQAIADFDAAIAQRVGLSLSQLADAEDNRAAAYQEAGIAPGETVVSAAPGQPVVPVRATMSPQVSPPQPQQAQSFLTTTSINQPEPVIPTWGAAAALPAKPEKGPRISLPGERQGQSFRTTTSVASTQPMVPAWPAATTAPSLTERARRTLTTDVAPAPSAPLPSQPAAATGDIRVQVARVQTQSEAYALVVRLISQHGAEFDPSMLKIERGVANGKTVAYLVRLGPLASAEEAQKRCSALHKSGFDCVVQY